MFAKNIKKGLCLTLAFGMVCTGVSMPSEAAQKTKLVTKKMTLKPGQSKKIVIKARKKKAKYSFSSSSKKKATVSKAGKVTAKKTGTVTIKVKEKYKKKVKTLGKVKVVIKTKKATNVMVSASPVVTGSATPTATVPVSPTATVPVSPTATAPASPTAVASATAAPTKRPAASPTARPSTVPGYEVPAEFQNRISKNAGKVVDITYDSTVVAEGKTVARKAKVVLPKGYSKDKKYPVVYMQHGIFGDETSLYNDGTQYVVWNAIANGDAKDMIVVFPNACANETGRPVEVNGNGFNLQHYAAYDNFINDLTKCLMPYINSHYSTLAGRKNTAICGFSMGGRVSLQIGFTKPEDFGYIGGFCPAFGIFQYTNNGVTEPGFFKEDTFTLKPEYMNNTLVLIAAGPNDGVVRTEPKRYADALEKNKVPHIYYETMGGDSKKPGGGGHEKAVYQHGLYNFLKRIFKNEGGPDNPQPTPTPVPGGNTDKNDSFSLDMTKADTAIADGAGIKAAANSTTGCLDVTLPQFQGAILKNTAAAPAEYKKVTITYKADSAINAYVFDSDLTDGIGQTPAGQHEVAALLATEEFKEVSFEAGSDYKNACLTALKLVHVDFGNDADKHIQIKSVVFSK